MSLFNGASNEELKAARSRMKPCPYCASTKVKLTKVSKGSYSGNKIQGICNACYSRGPVVSDDIEKAIELWNTRLAYEYVPDKSLKIDSKQIKRFMNGEILLNTRTKQEYFSVLKVMEDYCEESLEDWLGYWDKYREQTVISSRSSISDDNHVCFGYCSEKWYKDNENKPIETLKILDK